MSVNKNCSNCEFQENHDLDPPCSQCSKMDNRKPNFNWHPKIDVSQHAPTPNANTHQEGGNHYITLSVQPWDAMAAWMSKEAFNGFLRGNVIKYIARDKGGIEDLKKARHYLDKLIEESNV